MKYQDKQDVHMLYLLYNKFSEKKLESHDFMIALARLLIEEAPNAPKPNTFRGQKTHR